MTKQHIEVITSVERRRRWSQEDKERLVAACLEPGVSVSEVARAAGCHVSQLFRWRKQLCTISDGRAYDIPWLSYARKTGATCFSWSATRAATIPAA